MARLLLLFFASSYFSLCTGSACPDNFLPFKTSVNCIRIVTETLNFSASVNAANNFHHQSGEKGRLVSEKNNILGIRFHAGIAGSSGAIWVASSQFNRSTSNFSSCPALEPDGIVRERQCSDKLPYAVVVDITVPIRQNFTAQITYIRRGASVSLTAVTGIVNNSETGKWKIPVTAEKTNTSQIGRTLVINEFNETIHGGRYNFVEQEGNVSVITDIRLLKEAVIGRFSVEPVNYTIPEGGQIALECKSVGSRPRPTVDWYKNGRKILGNGDCVTSQPSAATCVSRLGTLFVTNFSVSDQGLYSCIISNIAGNITSRVALVQVETNTSALQEIRLEFSVEPYDQHLLLGDSFTTECAVSFYTPTPASGELPPFLTYFYINGNSRQMYMYPDDDAKKAFPVMLYQTIGRPKQQFVNCHVFGVGISHRTTPVTTIPVSTTSRIANITVQERAIITGMSVTTNGTTDTNSMLNVTLGSNVTITCSLQGDPTPVLSWIHNGVTRSTVTSSSTSDLIIEDFQSKDAGVYQCQAENTFQISIQSVFLVAIDAQARPSAIKDFSVQLVSKSSAHVSWTPVTIQNTFAPLVQYRVIYRQANNATFVASNLIASNNHMITNLQSDTTYDISVLAVSIARESEIATIKQVRTPPAIATTLLDQFSLPSSSVIMTSHTSSVLTKPTIAPLNPINEFVPLTVSISVVVAITIVIVMFIVIYLFARRCWWLRTGKGNYSPTGAERDINHYTSRPHSVVVTPGVPYPAPEEAFMSTLSLDEIQDSTEEEMVEEEIVAGYTDTAVVLREKSGNFNETDGDRVISGVFDRLEPLNA